MVEYVLWRYKYPKNILPKICGPTDVSRGSDSDDLVTKSSQTNRVARALTTIMLTVKGT